jgi:hypothetical protein
MLWRIPRYPRSWGEGSISPGRSSSASQTTSLPFFREQFSNQKAGEKEKKEVGAPDPLLNNCLGLQFTVEIPGASFAPGVAQKNDRKMGGDPLRYHAGNTRLCRIIAEDFSKNTKKVDSFKRCPEGAIKSGELHSR